MKSLARMSVRRRWLVLATWIFVFIGINVASQTLGSTYSNSFSLPGTNSTHALDLLKHGFKSKSGDVDQIVFSVTSGHLANHERSITTMLDEVAKMTNVGSVTSPFCPSGTSLCPGSLQVNKSGTISFATVNFTKQANLLTKTQIRNVQNAGEAIRSATLHVNFGGNAFSSIDTPSGSPGEGLGLLATAVVLFLAFGSLFAMLLPLGVALFAIGIASAATTLLSHGVPIAQFAPILGSLIGLGVGIDYALFIVTRSRQNLKQGMTTEEAIVTSVNTSGRAVLFAGITVCVALLGMLLLGFSVLDGLGIAAALTVAITMLAALTLLPALLAFQKDKVLSRRERRKFAASGPDPVIIEGGWQRWARFVARRPRELSLVSLLVIVTLAIPLFSLHLGISDAGSDPSSSTTRMAYDLLAEGFGPGFNGPLTIVGSLHDSADKATMESLASTLSSKPGVAAVLPLQVNPQGTVGLLNVISKYSPQDTKTSDLITMLRDKYIPDATRATHTAIYVGGQTALANDFSGVLDAKIPLFITIIVILGCLLLMVAFRSILIPLTAAVMNLLAMAASFGLVVAVFQWGWGSSLIGSGSGPIESYLPIVMIAILFGLSMDYQVFLVSRMHEEWVNTHNNEDAIIHGQANTGRVITAAALIMVCVFFSFAIGGERIIAEFGIGLGGAVLMDAFILRTVLVPSLMHFFGKANWWMPRWLDRVVPHVAVEAAEEGARETITG
jgi:RND superfamily putative drug exporter